MGTVYMDYNATTPLVNDVLSEIHSALDEAWGNPSSSHEAGRKSRTIIELSRRRIATMIGVQPSEIIFTSGGTESNNLAIHSAIQYFNNSIINTPHSENREFKKPHIITTNIEHDSVKLPLEALENAGKIDVTVVPVLKLTGQVNYEDIIRAIRPQTCLITVMMANNETGILQPVGPISVNLTTVNHSRTQQTHNPLPRILLHTDAAQAIGKIKVECGLDLCVDYLTIVGHKFYGPRIGALYFRNNCEYPPVLYPMFFGGGQENNYRPGTENTGMIAGLGKAAELVSQNLDCYETHMTKIRNYLEKLLKEAFKDKVVFNNVRFQVPRLPNTSSVAFELANVSGPMILTKATKIFASTGAACHLSEEPSSILLSSGVSKELSGKTLRLSVGRETTEQDVETVVADLRLAVSELCGK